ncbi:hypothetical protein [Pseudomonas sp. LB3P31]
MDFEAATTTQGEIILKQSSFLYASLAFIAATSFTTPLYAQDAEKILTDVVKQQQQQLPIMLDPATRIDNITYADRTVRYKLTLAGYEGRPGEQAYYQSYLAQQINKTLCGQTAYLMMLALGNRIIYEYASSNAQPIAEITLESDSCHS